MNKNMSLHKILSGKVYFISQFDGGWDDEWPEPLIMLLSEGKMRTNDDLLFYNSSNEIDREIRGGRGSVKISADKSIEGPIDGYDDGEYSGRILRAAGYNNFWFYEIDFSQINDSIDRCEYIILDYDNFIGKTKNVITLPSFFVKVIKVPSYSKKKDYFEFLSDMVPCINNGDNCLVTDIIPFKNISNCLLVGSFVRINSSEWKYESKWEAIDLEDFINSRI